MKYRIKHNLVSQSVDDTVADSLLSSWAVEL